jgi:hypothetical protein
MVGDGEVRISLTEDGVQEFGNWLLRCGIDRVEVEFSDNHPFDPTEVCRLFGIPILSRAATNGRKQEENDQTEELRAYLKRQSRDEWLAIMTDPKRAPEEFRKLIPQLPLTRFNSPHMERLALWRSKRYPTSSRLQKSGMSALVVDRSKTRGFWTSAVAGVGLLVCFSRISNRHT